MSYRTRDVVELDVVTSFGDTINIRAFIGMLPEDMHDILMRQFVVRKMEGIVTWQGPGEDIQRLLTGSVSSPRRNP